MPATTKTQEAAATRQFELRIEAAEFCQKVRGNTHTIVRNPALSSELVYVGDGIEKIAQSLGMDVERYARELANPDELEVLYLYEAYCSRMFKCNGECSTADGCDNGCPLESKLADYATDALRPIKVYPWSPPIFRRQPTTGHS